MWRVISSAHNLTVRRKLHTTLNNICTVLTLSRIELGTPKSLNIQSVKSSIFQQNSLFNSKNLAVPWFKKIATVGFCYKHSKFCYIITSAIFAIIQRNLGKILLFYSNIFYGCMKLCRPANSGAIQMNFEPVRKSQNFEKMSEIFISQSIQYKFQ